MQIDYKEIINEFVQGFGITYPVRVADIAEYKGFSVQVFTPKLGQKSYDVAGAIDYEQHIIFVNENDAPTRQRFTIAHELGHLALHESEGSMVDFRNQMHHVGSSTKEVEANAFAADLLMPIDKFVKAYEKYKEYISLIYSMFNVSVAAVQVRIKNLKQQGLLE